MLPNNMKMTIYTSRSLTIAYQGIHIQKLMTQILYVLYNVQDSKKMVIEPRKYKVIKTYGILFS